MTRLNVFNCLVSLTIALSGAAYADSGMDAAEGNTLEMTMPDGSQHTYLFDRKGSYMATSAHKTSRGTWLMKGVNLCMIPDGGAESCMPGLGDHKAGDRWSFDNAEGKKIMVFLRPGNHGGPN